MWSQNSRRLHFFSLMKTSKCHSNWKPKKICNIVYKINMNIKVLKSWEDKIFKHCNILYYKTFQLFLRQTLYFSLIAFFTSNLCCRLNSESGSTSFRNLCRLFILPQSTSRIWGCLTWAQFHQRSTYTAFVPADLVIYKRVKCWWNWHLVTLGLI
jgi:hypothetical protein